jgi:hypothetical protein
MFQFYVTRCDTMDVRIQRISRDKDGFFCFLLGFRAGMQKNLSLSREIR